MTRRLCLALVIALLWAGPASAAIVFVQSAHNSGDNVTVTWGSTPTVGNHILACGWSNSTTDTLSIGDITATETSLGTFDPTLANRLAQCFCWEADAADNDFVWESSGTAVVRVAALEFSGGSCTQDSTIGGVDDGGTGHAVSVTTGVNGSVCLAFVVSSSVSNFSIGVGPDDDIPADGADIEGGDDVGISLGAYGVEPTAGVITYNFDSVASETSALAMACVQVAGVAGTTPKGMLLGIYP